MDPHISPSSKSNRLPFIIGAVLLVVIGLVLGIVLFVTSDQDIKEDAMTVSSSEEKPNIRESDDTREVESSSNNQLLDTTLLNDARDSDVQLMAKSIFDFQVANNGSLPEDIVLLAEGVSDPDVFDKRLELNYYSLNNTATRVVYGSSVQPAQANNSFLVNHNDTGDLSTIIDANDLLPNEDNIHIWGGYRCPDSVDEIASGADSLNYNHLQFPTSSAGVFIIVYKHTGNNDIYRCVDFSR